MRYLLWTVRFLVFIVVFSFAVKNSDPVSVRYYLGAEWQAPLIFVLLVTFCAGAAFGILACLGQLFRQRREIGRLRRVQADGLTVRRDAEAQRITQGEFTP